MLPEPAQTERRRSEGRSGRRLWSMAVGAAGAMVILLGVVALAVLALGSSWSDLRRVGSAFEGVIESRTFLSTAFFFAWSGAFVAVLAGALTLAHSSGRRGALAPVVGGMLLAVGVIDALHALSIVWWFDVANPAPRAEDALWHASRALFAGTLALAGVIALSRRQVRARTALIGAGAITVAACAALLAVAVEQPDNAGASLIGARGIATAATIGAFLFAGAALNSARRKEGGLLATALALCVAPHIAADLAFGFSYGVGGSVAYTAAMGLRTLAYLAPAIAVAVEAARAGGRAASLERRLQAATRCALDGVWEWPDVGHSRQRWSPRFYALLGYAPGELPASRESLLSLPAPEHEAALREALDGAIASQSSFEVRVRLRPRSGQSRWFCVRGEALRDEATDRLGMVGVIADVDAQTLMKDELAFQRRALDEHAIVAITDAKGTITYANDKFCQISKFSREELIGQNHRIVNSGHHPKQFFKRMYATIAQGKTWRGEIRNRAKDGSIYWVDTTIVPMLNAGGRIESYVAIRADITARKRAERELEQKNKQLEQFVYTVSHDLKTPIVTLKGYVGWMEEDLREGRTDELGRCAHRIREAAHRMETLVQDLLELSRAGKEIDRSAAVNLDALARDIASEHAASPGDQRVRIEIEDELPSVLGDEKRLRDVLDNLISNAMKYGVGDEGGLIRVGMRETDDELRVFVADEGPGIDPKYQDRIFNIFERIADDDEGTGVGLAIVRRVMEAHGGRAWVESTPGEGATFWIAFSQRSASKPKFAEAERLALAAA